MNTITFEAIQTSNNRLKSINESFDYEFKHHCLINDCINKPDFNLFEKLYSHYEGIWGDYTDWIINVDVAYDKLSIYLDKWKKYSELKLGKLQRQIEIEVYILKLLKNK